jgi:hypothetical protein
VVIAVLNGIHSDISTRASAAGPVRHFVAETVTGDTLADPWYLRIGRRKTRE